MLREIAWVKSTAGLWRHMLTLFCVKNKPDLKRKSCSTAVRLLFSWRCDILSGHNCSLVGSSLGVYSHGSRNSSCFETDLTPRCCQGTQRFLVDWRSPPAAPREEVCHQSVKMKATTVYSVSRVGHPYFKHVCVKSPTERCSLFFFFIVAWGGRRMHVRNVLFSDSTTALILSVYPLCPTAVALPSPCEQVVVPLFDYFIYF